MERRPALEGDYMNSKCKSFFEELADTLENTCRYIMMFNNCETVSSILAIFSCAWFDEYEYMYHEWKNNLKLKYIARNKKYVTIIKDIHTEFWDFKLFASTIFSSTLNNYARAMFLYTPFSLYVFWKKRNSKNIMDMISYQEKLNEDIFKSFSSEISFEKTFNKYKETAFYLDRTNFYF